ncbi:MAG: YidC/Oxa1 family membrane protein insertase [Bacilli bacterium]|nr:YidC/Oxa1 family membrane protein insertase [Bacilli bacterium]
MKNKFLKIAVISFLVFSLTGCTQVLKDKNKKVVTNETTGQSLTANILCQPSAAPTIKKYEENKINIEKLPKCENFKATSGGYEGIWATVFVKPLAWFIIEVGKFCNNYGIAVILITILIRLVLYPVTKKTAMQSENMKKAKPELDRLEKKYKNKDQADQTIMMQKSQEMMAIYKSYNISPMSGCLFSFIQIPLFFAFYEALNRLPVLFEEKLFGFQLGTSPMTAFGQGHYLYLIFIVLVIAATYFSMKFNKTAAMSADQEKQMKMMTNMMIVFIGIASLTISTGIALYWITNSTFTIVQSLLVQRRDAK